MTEHEGAVTPDGATETQVVPAAEVSEPAQVVPGAEAGPRPGQPPAYLPNGPGVDQWGKAVEYAPEDPAERSGAQNEHPPGDPESTPAGV